MQTVHNEQLLSRARQVIPNGMYGHESTGLLPSNAPQFFARAEGTYLWDYDGNQFIDLMSAYGPNLFGYRHPAIDAAYVRQLGEIDAATGPSAVMVELAEKFVQQVGHASWAMFCKNGTDATTMALMTARAHRGKKTILVAAGTYHGAAPWCTPLPAGTVPEDRAHLIYYQYNDAASLAAAAESVADDLAGIFVTPHRHEVITDNDMPSLECARMARAICDKYDALLIVDEVRAGFRIERDTSWCGLGVQPDLSTWGKAIANGHAISALVGSEVAREAAGGIYVTGSYWFAAAPMAAAVETLGLIRATDYLERTVAMGDQLRQGLASICHQAGLPVSQTGPSQMPLIMFNNDSGSRDIRLTYAFAEGMIEGGVHFHPFHNMFINAAMTDGDIDQILSVALKVTKNLPDLADYQVNPAAEALFGMVK